MAAKLDYYNLTHTGLSYSRQLTLHACGRKYELDAKKAIKGKIESATFSYGHAVGEAIQNTIAGDSYNMTVLKTWLAYTHDGALTENEEKSKKSIHHAVINAEEFHKKYHSGMYSFLDGWEVAKFIDPKTGEELPAVELTFVITLVDGFSFEGHIDLVLFHPIKNRYMVVELKTTGGNQVAEASYKNSNQALGYGVVIDAISANMNASSSYDVLYMVYKSRQKEIVPMVFNKTPADRVSWLNSLLTDVSIINLYEENGYPMHGESCYNYFQECEYFNICHMSDESIDTMFGTNKDGQGDKDTYAKMTDPTFMFSVEQLVDRQEQLIQKINAGNVDTSGEVDMLLDITQIT